MTWSPQRASFQEGATSLLLNNITLLVSFFECHIIPLQNRLLHQSNLFIEGILYHILHSRSLCMYYPVNELRLQCPWLIVWSTIYECPQEWFIDTGLGYPKATSLQETLCPDLQIINVALSLSCTQGETQVLQLTKANHNDDVYEVGKESLIHILLDRRQGSKNRHQKDICFKEIGYMFKICWPFQAQ